MLIYSISKSLKNQLRSKKLSRKEETEMSVSRMIHGLGLTFLLIAVVGCAAHQAGVKGEVLTPEEMKGIVAPGPASQLETEFGKWGEKYDSGYFLSYTDQKTYYDGKQFLEVRWIKRDYQTDLIDLEFYLGHLKTNQSDSEEILRIQTIMVHGYYIYGMNHGGGQVALERAYELTREIKQLNLGLNQELDPVVDSLVHYLDSQEK